MTELDQVRLPSSGGLSPTILVNNVSRWFGNVVSLSDVTLAIYPGITGLLGPNGAGKTTLLRIVAGLARPSSGEVSIFGEPVWGNELMYRRVGVMLEHESVYGFLTGRQFVEFAARMRLSPHLVEPSVEHAIKTVDLSHVQDERINTYSRGMCQRIRFAATIVHNPEILLLDEPLNGTDPGQRIQFQHLLRRFADEGRTILISSHVMEEVEEVADTVLLLVASKLAASGDYRAIRARLDKRPYHIKVVSSNPRALAAQLVGLDAIDAVSFDPEGALIVLSRNVGELQRVLAVICQKFGLQLRRVEPLDDSLESVFEYLIDT